jgi:UDP-3-O-[3-hydroxymyristoyl] glucosamine N-acyltransferase
MFNLDRQMYNGKNTVIWSFCCNCHIGNDFILHPNATIGADSFGFRLIHKFMVKKIQIGTCIIEIVMI